MANLKLKNIFKKYPNGFVAVHDLNLDIKDKEFVIFVGPSGCGKSATLRMIAGLEGITKGELYINDKLMNNVAPKDRNIAMVLQNYELYPLMSVYENMAFGLKLRKTPVEEIDKRVNEAAEILDIVPLLNKKPKNLSGSQRQKVAMGRAIVRGPKVFLMDEPISNLDARLRVQMQTEISKMHSRLQTTFVYVTHDQTEAMALGTRIVVMKDGHMQQVDTPTNLYNCPNNLFVASFIGSPQMNFIECIVCKENGSVFLKFADFKIPLPKNKAKILLDNGYEGKEVIMGIRPENLHDEDGILEAHVEVIEKLGAEVYLYMLVGGQNITACVDPQTTARPHDKIKLGLDVSRIHVFDKNTELAIVH